MQKELGDALIEQQMRVEELTLQMKPKVQITPSTPQEERKQSSSHRDHHQNSASK